MAQHPSSFPSLRSRPGNPALADRQRRALLELILRSRGLPQQGPSTAPTNPQGALPPNPFPFEAPLKKGINRGALPPAPVNPLNVLDRFQAGRNQPPAVAGTPTRPGLAPGLPGGPSFVPGSPANVKQNFAGTAVPPTPISPQNRLEQNISNIPVPLGAVGPTQGPPVPAVAAAPQVNRRSGPSLAGAIDTNVNRNLPGQQLVQVAEAAPGTIATRAKDKVGPKQAARLQDLAKKTAGASADAKPIPAYALPLVAMGLTMAASKRTDTLGALAEGGLAGLQTFITQRSSKRKAAVEKRELDIKQQRADAATTTAKASQTAAEAAIVRNLVAAGAPKSSIGKKAADIKSLVAAQPKFKKFFEKDKNFLTAIGAMDDLETDIFKAAILQAMNDPFRKFEGNKPLSRKEVEGMATSARIAAEVQRQQSAPTAASPGPAARTGSRRTIGPEGLIPLR